MADLLCRCSCVPFCRLFEPIEIYKQSRTGALTAVKRQIKALADPRDRQEDGMFHQGFSAEIYKPEGSAQLCFDLDGDSPVHRLKALEKAAESENPSR